MIGFLGLLIAIAGLMAAWPSHASNRRASREASLRSAYTTFANDSAILDRKYYRDTGALHPLSQDSEKLLGGLLGRPGWCYTGGPLRVMNDESIKITLKEDGYDDWITPRLRRTGLFPYKRWDLLSNLRTTTGEGPKWSSRVFAVNFISGTYESGFKFNLYEGEYYDFYNTSIGMGLLAAFEQASANGTNTKLSRLRSKMWTATSESIEIQGYFALTAVSCLTVVVNDEGASMLLHRRGYDLADNRGMVGVIPSGSHSTFLDADTPVTFLDTLKREFAEELLDVDETGESPRRRVVEEAVDGLIQNDRVYLLGIGMYPTQGYFMVLALCVIDERSASVKSWLSSKGATSVVETFIANYEGDIFVAPFKQKEIDAIRRIHRRTPCLGEIIRIISENFDEVNRYVIDANNLSIVDKNPKSLLRDRLTSISRAVFKLIWHGPQHKD